MKSSIVNVFLACLSTAFCSPAIIERDAASDAPGSILPTPAALPSYSPTASPASVPLTSKFQWQIYKSCPDANRKTINQAWAESKQLSDALAQWKPKGAHQDAMDMYMGTRSTYQNYFRDPPWDFPRQIQNTIDRHQGLFEGKSGYGNARLWVYCNEDSFWFSHCTKNPTTSAIIAYEQEATFTNDWYITFCPEFYDNKWMIPLGDRKSDLEKSNPNPNEMESYYGPPGIQAGVFFHETMHMSQLVTSPQAVDKAYGPKDVYDLAKNSNTDSAVYNADSWTCVAEAIWAQNTFNLNGPPKPAEYLTPAGTSPSNENAQFDVMYVDSAGVTPQGAKPVPSGQDFYVDPNLWEIQDPAGGPPPAQPSASASSAPKPSSTPQAPPPYATGTCSFHLKETQDCESWGKNLYAIINMKDGAQNDIGDTNVDDLKDPIGIAINDGDSYSFQSKLPHPLVVTGEHENDYIQFTYGDLSWQSKTPNGGAHCNVGGWDPRDGPICGQRFGNTNADNNMDCFFPC